MGNPQFATRLPEDTAEELERYCEEHGINKAAAIRRFVRKELEIEQGNQVRISVDQLQNEDQDEEEEIVTDGGAVLRPFLRNMNLFLVVLGMISVLLVLQAPAQFVNEFGPTLVSIVVSCFIAISGFTVLLYTSIPERIDKKAHQRIEKLVSGV